MMMMVLYSCSNTCVQQKDKLKELDPIHKVRISKPSLDCLGKPLKKVVLDRILNCDDRLETLELQIKAHNVK